MYIDFGKNFVEYFKQSFFLLMGGVIISILLGAIFYNTPLPIYPENLVLDWDWRFFLQIFSDNVVKIAVVTVLSITGWKIFAQGYSLLCGFVVLKVLSVYHIANSVIAGVCFIPHVFIEIPVFCGAMAMAMQLADDKANYVTYFTYIKKFVVVIIPLLAVSAAVETWITPRVVLWYVHTFLL